MTQNQGTNSKMKKFLTIIGTSLLLLIPVAFMYGIIEDRISYKNDAIDKVAQSWAEKQVIEKPEMFFTTKNSKKEDIENKLELNNYEAIVTINTEIRKKGIFKIPVYTAKIVQKGDFKNKYGNLNSKQITTKIKISDVKGFISEPCFKINNAPMVTAQDISYTTNINTDSPIVPFEITYEIRGLNSIDVELGGYKNKISIAGNWNTPEFKGDYLPIKKTVTSKDFSATWSVPKIALKEIKLSNDEKIKLSSWASVSLLVPVDSYSMAERSLKYGYLLLFLTFMSYFIYEISSKENNKIHPIQYCLLGGSILIFYLLLVSISELTSFNFAYFISALMVMFLIFSYTHYVITRKNNLSFSIGVTSLMGLLYIYFYILLRLQDIALLAGSIGLFIIMAIVMYLTRNVNWYNEKNAQ